MPRTLSLCAMVALLLVGHGCAGDSLTLDPDTQRLRRDRELATALADHLATLAPIERASVLLGPRPRLTSLDRARDASVIALLHPGFAPTRSDALRRTIAHAAAATVPGLRPDDVTIALSSPGDARDDTSFTALFDLIRQPVAGPPPATVPPPAAGGPLVAVGPLQVAEESRGLARLLLGALLLLIALLALWIVRAERRIVALQDPGVRPDHQHPTGDRTTATAGTLLGQHEGEVERSSGAAERR